MNSRNPWLNNPYFATEKLFKLIKLLSLYPALYGQRPRWEIIVPIVERHGPKFEVVDVE